MRSSSPCLGSTKGWLPRLRLCASEFSLSSVFLSVGVVVLCWRCWWCCCCVVLALLVVLLCCVGVVGGVVVVLCWRCWWCCCCVVLALLVVMALLLCCVGVVVNFCDVGVEVDDVDNAEGVE